VKDLLSHIFNTLFPKTKTVVLESKNGAVESWEVVEETADQFVLRRLSLRQPLDYYWEITLPKEDEHILAIF